VPLLPQYSAGRDATHLVLRSFDGKPYRYPDPARRRPD